MAVRKRKLIYLLIITVLFANACSLGGIPQTTAGAVNQPVQEPVGIDPQPTNTKFVFPTLIPTNTSIPQPTMRVCNVDETLEKMEMFIPYSEYELYFFHEESINHLNVWFVDSELKPDAIGDELSQNFINAQNHALSLAEQLNFSEECLDDLFTKIGLTVVDQYYNIWFTGSIYTTLLPDKIQTDPDQLAILAGRFEVSFRRSIPGEINADPPSDSCGWKQVHQNIVSHFDPGDKNIAFFYNSGETGRTIVAQWEGTRSDMNGTYLTSLQYIINEMICLYPEPNKIIYYLVDESGSAIGGGRWDLPDPKNPDLADNSPFLLE